MGGATPYADQRGDPPFDSRSCFLRFSRLAPIPSRVFASLPSRALNRSEPTPWSADELADLFRDNAAGLAGAVRGVLGGRTAQADVQEVLHDAFLKALRNKPAQRAPESVAWVFVIVLNLARDVRRKRDRRGRPESLDDESAAHVKTDTKTPEPGAHLERAEALSAARDAIGQLAESEREVFLLRVSAELSFEGVAQSLGIPVGTAKTRMRAALAKLREALAAHDPALGVHSGSAATRSSQQ